MRKNVGILPGPSASSMLGISSTACSCICIANKNKIIFPEKNNFFLYCLEKIFIHAPYA